MLNLLIIGPNGKMGRAMVFEAFQNPGIDLVAGVGPPNREYIGMDLGSLIGLGRTIGVRVSDCIEDVIGLCDVVADCTRPEVSLQALVACKKHHKAFVTGTTGFSKDEINEMRHTGKDIPVLHASNTSTLFRLLFRLIQEAANTVGKEADVDIIEMHGNTKLDAPSGTAKEIGKMIAEAMGLDLNDIAEYGRKGKGLRSSHSVCFNSIRSGGIPSSHQVVFGFQNERIELVHHAYNMSPFARGMIRAALFIQGQIPGFYDFDPVLESV
jgi:4-hydroxy-tetrahydrodipicolinate reductase